VRDLATAARLPVPTPARRLEALARDCRRWVRPRGTAAKSRARELSAILLTAVTRDGQRQVARVAKGSGL
jgi:hypothetical protein